MWTALALAGSGGRPHGCVEGAPLVALCLSGQLRGAETRGAALRATVRDVAAALGPTRVFASIHVSAGAWGEGSLAATTAAALSAVVGALNPAAHEVYDSGAFQCAAPGSGGVGGGRGGKGGCADGGAAPAATRQACTFLAQFTGVWRSWKLALEDEARTGLVHTLAVEAPRACEGLGAAEAGLRYMYAVFADF
jgi:hypothetical protein